MQSCYFFLSFLKYVWTILVEGLQDGITLNCRCPRFHQESHMRKIIAALSLPNIRRISCHEIVGHIHYEIYLNRLLLSLLPTLIDQSFLLSQFFDWFSTDEQASDMIIVLRGVPFFEAKEVSLHSFCLLVGWLSLQLIVLLMLVNTLPLSKIGLGVYLLHYLLETVLACPFDEFHSLLAIRCEYSYVCWVLFVMGFLALLHQL